MLSVTQAIEKAIEIVGGQAALARSLGVKPQMVFQWKEGLRPVSIEKAIQIEELTNRAVTRHDLCPALSKLFGAKGAA